MTLAQTLRIRVLQTAAETLHFQVVQARRLQHELSVSGQDEARLTSAQEARPNNSGSGTAK